MFYTRLSGLERDQISYLLGHGQSIRAIAKALGRSPSTISREVRKYRWYSYQPIYSHELAKKQAKARKLGKCKLDLNPKLREEVLEKLKLFWSPEQIANFLKNQYKEASMQASKETIYTYLYVFLRRNMREEFLKYMRRGHKRRHSRSSKEENAKFNALGEIQLIDERPQEVNDRLVPGHWEGDLIIGGGKEQTALGTLVERTTRYVILVPLKDKSAQEVRTKFAQAISSLPKDLRRSLTYDQGTEMSQHRLFTAETEMKVYFAHPKSPWERGTNENTNGLIRQFFPKGTLFNKVSVKEIKKAQDLLNERPRKTLGFKTPAEKLAELLH